MQAISDILQEIALRCDPDEIVSRLGLTSEELCELLSDQILDNLSAFDDVYESDDEERVADSD